jgi:hypothetical protein
MFPFSPLASSWKVAQVPGGRKYFPASPSTAGRIVRDCVMYSMLSTDMRKVQGGSV